VRQHFSGEVGEFIISYVKFPPESVYQKLIKSVNSLIFCGVIQSIRGRGRFLRHSVDFWMLFTRIQVSTFFVEAVDLGDLQKLIVDKSAGAQWHLQQIAVKRGAFAPNEDVFHCDRCTVVHLSFSVFMCYLQIRSSHHHHHHIRFING